MYLQQLEPDDTYHVGHMDVHDDFKIQKKFLTFHGGKKRLFLL